MEEVSTGSPLTLRCPRALHPSSRTPRTPPAPRLALPHVGVTPCYAPAQNTPASPRASGEAPVLALAGFRPHLPTKPLSPAAQSCTLTLGQHALQPLHDLSTLLAPHVPCLPGSVSCLLKTLLVDTCPAPGTVWFTHLRPGIGHNQSVACLCFPSAQLWWVCL